MNHQVLVTHEIDRQMLERLQTEAELDIVSNKAAWTQEEIIQRLQGKDALLCTVTDPIGEKVIEACPRLQIISNYGVGYNHIDLEAASKRGIVVTNTPDVLTEATADLTWALLLDVARRVTEGDRLVRQGRWRGWEPSFMQGTEVTGKTLGIIGMGRIGRAVARRARGFAMNILYYSRTRLPLAIERELGLQFANIDSLLAESDFVSLHTPYTPATYHLIGARELGQMKESAFLINTARGAVVDEQALIRALQEKKIAGAALDVYEREPLVPNELIRLDNVVLAPHLGSATKETRRAMAELAVQNLADYFAGKKPRYLVNEEVWEMRSRRLQGK
ncbi:D-glycerate dehydrogenase [Thermoactinomyces sp. CICC 10522]|uniref:2-hydroxyacid dehydrogenase n=1 Tax=Thermoactinomyces sp. CICC 10522 TaxID=2767427 RepID=UPI001E3C55A1|nr:D-glycerate dehydrogenase [Thermoactinomyces sp. CICC 10522]